MTVVVDNHGTGGGFSRYLQGEVDLVDASRAAKPDEEAKAKAQGLDWTRFVVGYDGITLVVHPKNDFVKSLTVAQLKAIWEPDSKVQTWKDVDPSWPARKIVLYSPDRDSGTFEFFTEAVMGKAKGQREDVQASSDDNTLVNGVAGDPDGLGYFGYAYFESNAAEAPGPGDPEGTGGPGGPPEPGDRPGQVVRPALASLVSSTPRTRPCDAPRCSAFVKYYLDNVADLATRARYVAPTAEDQAANQAALSAVEAGRDHDRLEIEPEIPLAGTRGPTREHGPETSRGLSRVRDYRRVLRATTSTSGRPRRASDRSSRGASGSSCSSAR